MLLFVVGLKLDLNYIRHIGVEALGLTTLVGLVTITVSTHMILNSRPLYARLAPWLGMFEHKRPFRELVVERQRQ